MSDERLRELERRWKASGLLQDEAALLIHRVRTQHLEPGRLALAAWVQYPAAELAAADPALDAELTRERAFARANQQMQANPRDALVIDVDPRGSMAARVMRLTKWAQGWASRRAALAGAWATGPQGWTSTARGAYAVVTLWVLNPTQENRDAIAKFLTDALPDPNRPRHLPDEPMWVVDLLCCGGARGGSRYALSVVERCVYHHPQGEAAIWKAIGEELGPWALGYEDPLIGRIAQLAWFSGGLSEAPSPSQLSCEGSPPTG